MSELILLTSSFPNYPDEPFLEKEFAYLEGRFEKISFVTVTTHAPAQGKKTQFRDHDVFEIALTSSGKLKTLLTSIFNRQLLAEAKYIRARLPIGSFASAFKVAVVSWNKAEKLKRVVLRKLAECESEEVVIYSYWGDEGAVVAAMLADHPKVKKAVTRVHGWDVNFSVHQPAYLPFRTFIQRKCWAIFPISNYGKNQIEQVWKVPTTNVFVARLGVDRQEIAEHTTTESVFTLVSCSNLIPLKRVQLIAEAVLRIQKPIKWVHFGDGAEWEQVKAIVKDRQKEWHDIHFPGKVENDHVLDFYRSNRVDAFINASTTEGIPFSIMEAMSFGIPALATDVGGNAEIVDATSGVLLPSNPSAEEICQELERFMDLSSDEVMRYQQGAYAKWEGEFNAKKNFSEFVEKLL